MTRRAIALGVLLLMAVPGSAREERMPDWVGPMRKVHQRFTGKKGTFALFGDSISVSLAFWAGLPSAHKNMDRATRADLEIVQDYQAQDCWRKWRGGAYGNEGGM